MLAAQVDAGPQNGGAGKGGAGIAPPCRCALLPFEMLPSASAWRCGVQRAAMSSKGVAFHHSLASNFKWGANRGCARSGSRKIFRLLGSAPVDWYIRDFPGCNVHDESAAVKSDFKSSLAGAEQSQARHAAPVKYRFGRYLKRLFRLAVATAATGRAAGVARSGARIERRL